MSDPLRLYGLKALVTNAADGLGEAIARTLVKHGATVLAADTAASGVEQHYRQVRGITGHVSPMTDSSRVPALVDACIEKLGGLDIVVGDFPYSVEAPIESPGPELDRLLELRSALVTSLARSALPELKKSPAGRIISIGFLRSLFAARAGEAIQKAERDLAALTRALAADTGEFGITANYVQPGAIMTPQSRETFRRNKALRDYCIAHSAARRVGEPVDVAKVVLFLASDDAVFVSGTGIAVDGGRTDV